MSACTSKALCQSEKYGGNLRWLVPQPLANRNKLALDRLTDSVKWVSPHHHDSHGDSMFRTPYAHPFVLAKLPCMNIVQPSRLRSDGCVAIPPDYWPSGHSRSSKSSKSEKEAERKGSNTQSASTTEIGEAHGIAPPLAGLQGQNLKYHLPTGVGVISTPEFGPCFLTFSTSANYVSLRKRSIDSL
jgi:hypothetical protein